MEKRFKVYLSFLIVIVLIMVLYFFTSWFSKTTGFVVGTEKEEVKFAKCLREKNVVFYGTDKCVKCVDIKEFFKEGFSELNYVDCFVSRECHDLERLPAWEINGEIFYELNEINSIKEMTGC